MSRESDANDTRVKALSVLEEARSKLHAWRFLSALKTAPQEDRDAAAQAMLDVAVARQTLSAAILADIVEELEQVKPVLDAIGTLVSVVGRIVSLI
jgi:hypothetical protein